jgi:hypothetical protein
MLKNLLNAAIRFELLTELAALLRHRVAMSRDFYQTLDGAMAWSARLDHLEGLLDTIESGTAEASSARPEGP